MEARKAKHGWIWTTLFSVISVAWVFPIFLVVLNSFKKKVYISKKPFAIPTGKMFVGLENYVNGINKTGLISAFGWSVFITVFSVAAIILFCSMTAWYITRVKSKVTSTIYYLCLFSMIVPFQMVMYTLSKIANMLKLGNPVGIIVVYLGFGAGLSVFMFTGFCKSIPIEIEEAAMIDGCNPLQTFFKVVMPIMKPTCITVTILQAMWIWNDFLLPNLIINRAGWQTLPLKTYLFFGQFTKNWDLATAGLILCMVPIIIFYVVCQRYIVKGVTDGAVKG